MNVIRIARPKRHPDDFHFRIKLPRFLKALEAGDNTAIPATIDLRARQGSPQQAAKSGRKQHQTNIAWHPHVCLTSPEKVKQVPYHAYCLPFPGIAPGASTATYCDNLHEHFRRVLGNTRPTGMEIVASATAGNAGQWAFPADRPMKALPRIQEVFMPQYPFNAILGGAVLAFAAISGPPAQAACPAACLSFFSESFCRACSIDSQPQSRSSFGAIALDRGSGSYGYSFEWDTWDGAEAAAMRECRSHVDSRGGCSIVLWFSGACGALAQAGSNWATAWAGSSRDAAARARGICESKGTACKVSRTVCSF